jgi:hypothetical protein
MTELAPLLKAGDLKDKFIFLDNDFLGIIFSEPDVLKESLPLLEGYRTIDAFTKLEFLRDVWLPETRRLKEEFIGDEEIFFQSPTDSAYVFGNIKENALTLSRLYAHNKKVGASLIDLMLAGTLMLYKNSVLVTGNKKDFPSFIFDVVGVINYEQSDWSVRAISVVRFNAEKFNDCEDALGKVRG